MDPTKWTTLKATAGSIAGTLIAFFVLSSIGVLATPLEMRHSDEVVRAEMVAKVDSLTSQLMNARLELASVNAKIEALGYWNPEIRKLFPEGPVPQEQ